MHCNSCYLLSSILCRLATKNKRTTRCFIYGSFNRLFCFVSSVSRFDETSCEIEDNLDNVCNVQRQVE